MGPSTMLMEEEGGSNEDRLVPHPVLQGRDAMIQYLVAD